MKNICPGRHITPDEFAQAHVSEPDFTGPGIALKHCKKNGRYSEKKICPAQHGTLLEHTLPDSTLRKL